MSVPVSVLPLSYHLFPFSITVHNILFVLPLVNLVSVLPNCFLIIWSAFFSLFLYLAFVHPTLFGFAYPSS